MKVRRIVIAGASALAACGVLGMVPSAVQASSAPAATWTQQHPAVHPPPLAGASMAYDVATGTVVLFGGNGASRFLGDTWTWNGTTWTQQHPATSPPARDYAVMDYDAATGTEVLFGGFVGNGQQLADTWTWNGTTWTKQAPATSPPGRDAAVMAYDPATGTEVLFGGYKISRPNHWLGDTWTWNGRTWTQRHVVHPALRSGAAMAYDATTHAVVLFGGYSHGLPLADTWTWNGTTWTQQAPAAAPPARYEASMAYDAATGTEVLFGGLNNSGAFHDTWTWG